MNNSQKSKNLLNKMSSKLAEPLSEKDCPDSLHQDIMMCVEQARHGVCGSQQISPVRNNRRRRPLWIVLGTGAVACCISIILWIRSSPEVGDDSHYSQQGVESKHVEVGSSKYESEALSVLIQQNPSNEVYENEVGGLIDFLGANAQLLFSRHDVMKKGEQ